MKIKIKEKQNEIEVLKEMVKSSSNSLKAKDIDIARLTKRVNRLEKLTEINKGFDGGRASRNDDHIIQERDEILEETQQFQNHGGFSQGLETQVNQELLQH